MHAMTIHKSQGSQADEVVVILPAARVAGCSPASSSTPRSPAPASACVVVGSPDDVRAAIDRRALRATGLRQRLRRRVRTLSHPKPARHERSPSVG